MNLQNLNLFARRCFHSLKKKFLIDDEILCETVRVIKDKKHLGDFNIVEARNKAKEFNSNLILFKNNTTPPICIIDDYDTFIDREGEETKKDAKITNSKHTYSFDPSLKSKTIQISDNCAHNDFNRKIATARKYIQSGIRVDVIIFTKGNVRNAQGQEELENVVKFSEKKGINLSFNLNNPLLQKIDYIYSQLNDIARPFTVKNKVNLNSKQIILKFWPI